MAKAVAMTMAMRCPSIMPLFSLNSCLHSSPRLCIAGGFQHFNAMKRQQNGGKRALRRRVSVSCAVSVEDSTISPTSSLSDDAVSIKKRVVSGVQPTGSIHLGNYLGAIKNWVFLQDAFETLFFIVDLHAITLPYDVENLSKTTRDTAALYMACGIDTAKACIFVQSHVQAHAELQWLLNCVTPIGWLNKMIQFKEKSRKAGDENIGTGLLTYPVLMASDILLYQCDLVPVGEDQKQHLELTRELAERVNFQFGGRKWKKRGGHGGKLFKIPEAFIPPSGARIMSLTDGLSKMSKSAPSDQSRINLLDTKDMITNKFKRCKTDSFSGLEFDNPNRPECNNLLTIYQLVTGKTKQEVADECKDMSWGRFKPLITDAVIEHLEPIQTRYKEITSDPTYVDIVLTEGAAKASAMAETTLRNVYQAMGFLPRHKHQCIKLSKKKELGDDPVERDRLSSNVPGECSSRMS